MMICATNSMRGRPCVMRGVHLEGCPWSAVEDEAARRGVSASLVVSERFVAGTPVPTPCDGCLPYKADKGMLCSLCDAKYRDALDITVDLVAFLISGGQRPADVNRSRGKPGPRLPIKDAKLAADSLWTHLAGVAIAHSMGSGKPEPEWPAGTSILDGFLPSLSVEGAVAAADELVAWVADDATVTSREGGAEAAVEFYRETQRQLARFPLEEKPKRVPYLKCRQCDQHAMVESPPLRFLGRRIFVCTGDPERKIPGCGAEMDPDMKEFNLAVYRQEVQEALGELERWPSDWSKPHDRSA